MLRESMASKKQDAQSNVWYARVTPRNDLKEKFLGVPELCLPALILLQLFGQVHSEISSVRKKE